MKIKNIFNLMCICAVSGALASCSGALDIDPTDRYSPSAVWSSESTADQYVVGLYDFLMSNTGNITSGDDGNMTGFDDAFSDILKSNSYCHYNHCFNTAMIETSYFSSTDAGCFECWSSCYNIIRRCNEFLRDAETYGPKISDTYAATRGGEVRFIRAFAYLKLMRVYNKCIIRSEVDGPDQNDKALATSEDVWKFIADDLTYAGQNIEEGLTRGRITRAAAWAMLSRAALYACDYQTVVNAADSCQKYGGALSSSYSDIFNNIDSPDNLLTIEYMEKKLSHRGDYYFRPTGDEAVYGYDVASAFNPTSELVDSYEMADGTDFSWSTNGADPYTGREPRFYATILYNGCPWENRTIETYVGGADHIADFDVSGDAGSTVTGYYMRKFITEGQSTWVTNGSDHFAIVIRYAEVLLNAAEAYAQLGKFTEANAALNKVRARVGLPERNASSLEPFMENLRHERMVELAGEGFRFWDLRRWRLAYCEDSDKSVIDGKNYHGCKITKNNDGSFKYEQIICDGNNTSGELMVHFFPERYYAFALPITEISNNALVSATDNNPGW